MPLNMLKYNCIHFPGDKPCKFHKLTGIKCNHCKNYKKINYKILIIKLDSLGDVLRTTCILPPLKLKYPDSYVSWYTRKEAKEIFQNNEFVDEVKLLEEDVHFRLNNEYFNLIINLDTSKLSASIATFSKGKEKRGFLLHEKGYIYPTNEHAKLWLEMSAFDDVKKRNEKTYQQIIYDILELKYEIALPILHLTNIEKEFSCKIQQNNGSNQRILMGLNTGTGKRWPNKTWPIENWENFIRLVDCTEYKILLLGGREEKERNEYLAKKFPKVVNTGHNNSIREFASIVNACDVIITADTFALHIATALEKSIIALFGPTSMNEILLYGKGIKIRADTDCFCYYNRVCTHSPSCMESIDPELVFRKFNDIIKIIK